MKFPFFSFFLKGKATRVFFRSVKFIVFVYNLVSKLGGSNVARTDIVRTELTLIKFIYSEKATKFCEIFTLLLSYVPVKSKVKISQNFVAFSEYMNFIHIRF